MLFIACAIAVLAGCQHRDDALARADGKVIVVATILPLADWAQQVGGDRVFVQTLLPAGASPHTFDPSPRDMRLVSHARLVLKVGLNMDDWGAAISRSAGGDGPTVLSLGEALQATKQLPDVEHFADSEEVIAGEAEAHDHSHGDDHGHHHHHHDGVNPHFWLDPVVAADCIGLIRDALINADPEGRSSYEANAAAYQAQLAELDKSMAAGLQPFHERAFVSFHNAWPYLAKRYHLRIAAVIEEYAGKAPGEKYLRQVTDRLKELRIKTVFTEPQLNPSVANVIASEVGATVGLLDPYGTASEAERSTYIKTMRFNLQQLEKAFSAEQ